MARPFHQLDLNLLRVLVLLERTRSVTAAGRALSLSQPATSNALARLRESFGDPLFVRTPAGLAPTLMASRLAASAAQALEALERELSTPESFAPTSSTRTWRLSLSDLGEMVFLPAIAETVLREAPNTRIINAAVPASELGDDLARRDVDMAIGILNPRHSGTRRAVLFSETYVALSQPGLTARQRSLAGLKRLGLVVAAPTATFHGGIEASLKRSGLAERIVMRTRHFAAMPDVVMSASLVGIVPSSWAATVCQRMDLVSWPLPVPMPHYDVNLVWHGTTEGDPSLDWLRALLLRLFRASASTP